jgi:hypothetical protein
MALIDTSKILISIKKLVGKAHTSNDKDVANEALPSGLTMSSNTIFGESIPTTINQSSDALYAILSGSGITGNGQVEYLRFQSSFILGSDTSDGRHGFELKLPADYEANSKNPLAGTYPFLNNQSINITSGSLQLVPPSYATNYEAKAFSGGNTTKDNGTQIPILDARDWNLDYFNGVFFQQDLRRVLHQHLFKIILSQDQTYILRQHHCPMPVALLWQIIQQTTQFKDK